MTLLFTLNDIKFLLQFKNFFALMVSAGNDTTRYTMTYAMKELIDRPDLMDELRSLDDAGWKLAIEEFLRWGSVTMHFRRTALKDAEVRGKQIKAGEQDADTGAGMAKLAAALVARGADAIIAGCTEIPLVLTQRDVSVPLISSTDVLAVKTVKLATGMEPLPQRLLATLLIARRTVAFFLTLLPGHRDGEQAHHPPRALPEDAGRGHRVQQRALQRRAGHPGPSQARQEEAEGDEEARGNGCLVRDRPFDLGQRRAALRRENRHPR